MKLLIFIFLSSALLLSLSAQQKPENEETGKKKKSETVIEEKENKKAEQKAWNKFCPVEGGEVEKDSPLVEFKGKLYGFCCPGCDKKFEKNPDRYSRNLSEDGKRFTGRK